MSALRELTAEELLLVAGGDTSQDPISHDPGPGLDDGMSHDPGTYLLQILFQCHL